ncbi:MAG: hypothetical protein ACXWC9_06020 [Pseudobdellovibrionaceae bacterium]
MAKSSPNQPDLLSQLDQLTRKGQQGSARQILVETNIKKIPRAQVAAFADLARRLNMPKLMLVLLRPLIHQQLLGEAPASIQEKALYATALSRTGVFLEAQKILQGLDDEKNPEVLLFVAQNLMLQWDYLSAIPKLKKYVARTEITPYMKWVGKVNLASSLIGEMRWKEAEEMLHSLRTELEVMDPQSEEAESYALLHANALGLLAHSSFLQGDLQGAQKAVQESRRILTGSQSRYELLAKKWQAIIQLFQQPKDTESLRQFRQLKEEAVKARDWETARDFEFFEALSLRDDEQFLRLYHGTPYTSYRKRIKKIYQPQVQIPKMVEWNFAGPDGSPTGDDGNRIFDLSKGCELGGRSNLASQPLLFRLLRFLTKDFFRPVALGSVFSALYPDEKFNPETSPNRAYLVAKRLRKWFETHDIPLEIEVDNEWFRLKALKPYAIRVSFQNFNVSKNDALLESLQRHFGERKFSADQVIDEIGLSPSQVQKFLTWAVQRRKLRRSKAGRSALFALTVKASDSF